MWRAMGTAAVLPVKRFDDAKQRLKGRFGSGSRIALASAMFADVLRALERSSQVDVVVLVAGEPAIRDLALDHRVLLVPDLVEKGQSHAARSGLARAATLGYERALLVPGDCPLMDPAELDSLIEDAATEALEVVIVPDRHERGTNALLVDPAGSFEPQFGPGSLKRHVEQAKRKGLRHSVERAPSLAIDVDTSEDLEQLGAVLEDLHGRAPRTQGVLRQLERSRLPPPVAV